MEEKVKIGEREYTVKELLYKDVAELADIEKKELGKKTLFLATDITSATNLFTAGLLSS